jgi:5'-AMP-activated protein kinase regulatory beta subunit
MQGQAQTKPGQSVGTPGETQSQAVDVSRPASNHSVNGGQLNYAESPVPGSPITYSPQLPMEPFAHATNFSFAHNHEDSVSTTHHFNAKTVPTVFVWSHGGQSVQLEGSFDNWTSRHVMQKSGKDFSLVKLLPPGVYQYKFIVDNQWRHDPNLSCMYDDQGNINNVLEVQEYVAENLDGLATFEPPPSPKSSYENPVLGSEDFMKEPPSIPPQLQLSLLNVPTTSLGGMHGNHSSSSINEASGGKVSATYMDSLPRPQHVILNHMYCQRGSSGGGSASVMVVGSTYRYKSKYVTTVLYRAKRPVEGDGGEGRNTRNMLNRVVRDEGEAMDM